MLPIGNISSPIIWRNAIVSRVGRQSPRAAPLIIDYLLQSLSLYLWVLPQSVMESC